MKDTQYVVGFAYTRNNEHGTWQVLLMRKNRPEWQAGLLNGIGGKIEAGEAPTQAMNRECKEECGLDLDWDYRGKMTGINNDGKSFVCHVFFAYDNSVVDFKQIEDEKLGIYDVGAIMYLPTIDNLKFIVPLGIFDDHLPFMNLTYPARTISPAGPGKEER